MSDTERQATTTDLPALLGGTPMRARMLPYGRQQVTEDDVQALPIFPELSEAMLSTVVDVIAEFHEGRA